jgi:hypothetical protein
MEEFQKLLIEANRIFSSADHLIYVTYPLVKDIKLLIKIIENLNIATFKYMDALLSYERFYKRIGPLPNNFDSRFEIFKRHMAKRYNLDRNHVMLLLELKELIDHHKRSKMEFIRKDKYVICGSNYRVMKTLNVEKVKDYINGIKPFVRKINHILSNDRLFRR